MDRSRDTLPAGEGEPGEPSLAAGAPRSGDARQGRAAMSRSRHRYRAAPPPIDSVSPVTAHGRWPETAAGRTLLWPRRALGPLDTGTGGTTIFRGLEEGRVKS
jgi:hypothetical protein